MKHKILISACLLGQRVRYDGDDNLVVHDALDRWLQEGRLVPVCPEVMGGLPTPRPPAEIQGGDGADVMSGRIPVLTNEGTDVTREFIAGAEKALSIAQAEACRFAVMAARSPSCGNRNIYDGHFSGQLVPGMGTTASWLNQHGIEVFNQNEIEMLIKRLEDVESS